VRERKKGQGGTTRSAAGSSVAALAQTNGPSGAAAGLGRPSSTRHNTTECSMLPRDGFRVEARLPSRVREEKLVGCTGPQVGCRAREKQRNRPA
jgi:hypothetical protein